MVHFCHKSVQKYYFFLVLPNIFRQRFAYTDKKC